MLLIKILLVGAAIVGGMVALKDGRLLARAGLVSSCEQVAAMTGQDGSVQRCRRGRLDGYPNLTQKSCVAITVRAGREYWRCPAPIVSSQAPRA